ncbi:MAG TPA: aminotransferase class III-fold pyridoxal phosphate-dependent enzyme, partial [bacterium]|nr:aminotransferase class III-fold pyridoxal phosphate-dependent enzyme [bacterium]HPP30623.1 aminotransferase class III-fold pyridoxal phosphate-dependent enzyme [bacterium]
VVPDIMTLAKTMGGGFPVGAMLAKKEIADLMVPGTHASTFGGGPLACASCLAVIDTIEKEKLLDNVNKMGEYLYQKLVYLKEKHPAIRKIKGLGLMRAMEMDGEGSWLVSSSAENGLLINCTQGNVIRIMPAITVNEDEIDEGIEILDRCLGVKK